ncbi:MAG: heavy metal translocating P-type ATPase [Candidatus Parabeggiatoa sp.]|nr:heavy metal translocating P-type ATPase [Candidatus Parabeggiatoa sp.]
MLIELAIITGAAYGLKKQRKNTTRWQNTRQPQSFSPKKLFKDIKSAFMRTEQQQSQELIQPNDEMNLEKMAGTLNRDLAVATGTLVAIFVGAVTPIGTALAFTGILYLSLPFFRQAWLDARAGYLINFFTVELILLFGMALTGQLIYAAIMAILANLKIRLILHTDDKSQKQLTHVFAGHPPKVWLLKDDIEILIDFEAIQVGDTVIVNAGEIIPVDGLIESGYASVDQHLLTGESQPIEKEQGDQVFAATLLLSGRIAINVQTAGNETVAAKIGDILNKTQHYKDSLMARGQNIANQLAPVTLSLGILTWATLGTIPALSVLWAAFGINMMALGPLSVLSYLQILARHGILVKDGRILESLRQVDTIVFDKTGTLTLEQPMVGYIHVLGDYDENSVLRFAATAEYRQPHPIAKAILAKAAEAELDIPEPDAANYEVGYGIKVKLDEHTIRVGSARFMQRESIDLPDRIVLIQQQAEEQGYSLIYVSIDHHLAGILEMQPSIRPEAADIINKLKQRGFKLCIISGDHEQPTRNLANQLGIDRYFAETLPENKAYLVKQLRDEGQFVCFIGDGINDAIALKSAQISISLKGASTAATDTAQIILMDGTLKHLENLFQLSDEFEDTMHTNFLTTIVPGLICIGGVYFLHFGLAASVTTYYLGSGVGLSNSLLPLVKHQDEQPKHPDNVD